MSFIYIFAHSLFLKYVLGFITLNDYLLSYLLTFLLSFLLTYFLTYLLTYLLSYLIIYVLTPRSRVLLENLTGSQLVSQSLCSWLAPSVRLLGAMPTIIRSHQRLEIIFITKVTYIL
jgi:hypothetical protein